MNPVVSIIIPVYNTEKYLKQCIDSVLNQTFENIEVICVDDGSTDESLKILEEYSVKDSRVRVYSQSNQGAAVARNFGLSKANGEYVNFLDSDDFLHESFVEVLYNKAISTGSDLVVCDAYQLNENDEISSAQSWYINKEIAIINRSFVWDEYPDKILGMFSVVPWNKLILKSMIQENNLEFQNLKSSNDVSFGIISRFFARSIFITNKKLVFHRVNRSNSITAQRGTQTDCVMSAFSKIRTFLKQKYIYNEIINSFSELIKKAIVYELNFRNIEESDALIKRLMDEFPEVYELCKKELLVYSMTPDDLFNKIADKRVYLWGASLFLSKVFERQIKGQSRRSMNIVAIIDKDNNKWGQDFYGYKVYSPEILNNVERGYVLLTINNNHKKIHDSLQSELLLINKNIKLLPDIFDDEN